MRGKIKIDGFKRVKLVFISFILLLCVAGLFKAPATAGVLSGHYQELKSSYSPFFDRLMNTQKVNESQLCAWIGDMDAYLAPKVLNDINFDSIMLQAMLATVYAEKNKSVHDAFADAYGDKKAQILAGQVPDELRGFYNAVKDLVVDQAMTASPGPGQYSAAQNVELFCTTIGAEIFYTLDGSEPGTGSARYSGPVPVSGAATLKAIAVKDGIRSNTFSFEYQITSSSGGGGGGGGSPGTTVNNPPVNIDDLVNRPSITLGEGTNTFDIPQEVLAKLAGMKKDLTLTRAGGGVILTTTPGSVDIPAGAVLTLKAQEVNDSGSAGLLSGLTPDQKAAGKIYELTAVVTDKDKKTSPVSFKKNLLITISYAGSTLAGLDEDKLGVYRYDEQSGKWEYVGGKVNKTDQTVTFATNHLSKYTVLENKKTFKDIAGHWAQRDIEIMAARDIAKGSEPDLFSPDSPITRSQFAALLARVTGAQDDPAKAPAFADVPAGAWYAKDLAAAYAAGLVKGYSDADFGPDDPVTREQIASMAVRAMAMKGLIKTISDADAQAQIAAMTDGQAISAWARSEVARALIGGVIKGYPDHSFKPQDNTTRAEGLVVLKHMMDQLPLN